MIRIQPENLQKLRPLALVAARVAGECLINWSERNARNLKEGVIIEHPKVLTEERK